MKEHDKLKKLLLPLTALGLLGIIAVTESKGITNIRHKNYGIVLDYTLEGRRGLPSKEERIYGVSQIWKKASDYFAGWELADTETTWDEAYEIACEEAENARTTMEYRRALEKFLAHLNHGNSENVGGPNLTFGWGILPFQLGYYSQEYVVIMTSDAAVYPIGTVVETINGQNTGVYLEETLGQYSGHRTPGAREFTHANNLYYGQIGESLHLEIRRPGMEEAVPVTAFWDKNNRLDPGDVVEMDIGAEGEIVYTSEAFDVMELDEDLCCFLMKSEMDLSCLDTYYGTVAPILARYDGVVLDWRESEAGNSLIGRTIVESFTGEPVPRCYSAPATIKVSKYVSDFGVWDSWRKSMESDSYGALALLYDQNKEIFGEEISAMLEFGGEMHQGRFEAGEEMETFIEERWSELFPGIRLEDREDFYQEQREKSPLIGKPVVMIVDKMTGGSSDSVAAEAKAAGITLVGTGTRGATGNMMMIDLGGGWMTAISTQRELTPEGSDITNRGTEAQVQVDLTAEDIAAGIDTQMEVAVEVLRGMIEDGA
ncbi:MAG: hypothetical protein IJ374_12080 [Lachnospiraceae bacterium]|nr:hypothetical protein [Lachnospiraceae bacterium]